VNEAGKKVGSELLPSPRDDAPNKFAVKRAIDEVIVQVARSRQLIAESRDLLSRLDRLASEEPSGGPQR
jgi:hypothetical protein